MFSYIIACMITINSQHTRDLRKVRSAWLPTYAQK